MGRYVVFGNSREAKTPTREVVPRHIPIDEVRKNIVNFFGLISTSRHVSRSLRKFCKKLDIDTLYDVAHGLWELNEALCGKRSVFMCASYPYRKGEWVYYDIYYVDEYYIVKKYVVPPILERYLGMVVKNTETLECAFGCKIKENPANAIQVFCDFYYTIMGFTIKVDVLF